MPSSGLRARIAEWDQAVWSLAAVALALDPDTDTDLRGTAQILLDALGVADDDIVLAQGHTSAQGARAFAHLAMPHLSGLAARLAEPDARMLDVGVGVAAMAVAFCEVFLTLTVVGIDTATAALRLADQIAAASSVADRVLLRHQDVRELVDEQAFDLAWLPAPFIPSAALGPGISRVVRALKPGGWLLLAHGRFTGNPIEDALNHFRTATYGGTALNDEDARTLLDGAGLTDIRDLPTPFGAPAITAGRM